MGRVCIYLLIHLCIPMQGGMVDND
jgi:hypothetical protein